MSQAVPAVITPALSAADLNTTINCEPRILDVRLAEVLGFDRPRNIRKLVERHRGALSASGEVCSTVEQIRGRGGRPGRAFWLTKKQALYICMKSETDRASDIAMHVIDVYDEVTSAPPTPSPDPNANIPRRRGLPAPITRELLETYASWLHMECARLFEELYPGEPAWRHGLVVTNPGFAFHEPRAGEVLPSPLDPGGGSAAACAMPIAETSEAKIAQASEVTQPSRQLPASRLQLDRFSILASSALARRAFPEDPRGRSRLRWLIRNRDHARGHRHLQGPI